MKMAAVNLLRLYQAGLLLLYVKSVSAQLLLGEKISVGAIFDHNTEEIQNVFKFAMMQHNQNLTRGRFELQAYVDVINTADAFKLSRLICNQFARGVYSMLGAVTPESFDTLHSYTNTFQMPFVTPWFPEKVNPPSSGLIDHAVSMRPDYHKAVIDTILHYGWKEIIYIYDSHDGLLRLQQLYQKIHPGRAPFQIYLVKRILNASDAIDFLLTLEQYDRWGSKHIVLDCNTKNAKNVIVSHVQNVQLGRRTYHYLLSGLVMDDHWENEVVEYGAVNITGFRIVDRSRKIVRDFMDGLRKMDPRFKEIVSAQAALLYDGVQVLIDALGRLWRKKPDAFRSMRRAAGQASNGTKVIDCNPGKSWVVPFEHGDKITRLIKKTDIEGLTGNISFNDEGRRQNFTLHVVDMTVQRAMEKVATWSDKGGFVPISTKQVPLQSPASFDTNKTYYVTTLLQEPYMMQQPIVYGQPKNEQFYGLCKDLIDIIAKELNIKYEVKLVNDGKYGSQQTRGKGEWSGLVGEILRKGADIAVASLAVTKDREVVVDFTEPFVSIDFPAPESVARKPTGTFGFLRPLSKEIWLCVLFSFFAVSIVLFLVSRFSPREWRSMSFTETNSDHSVNSTNEIILHNDFSIWNSLWFSLGSFMQQGSDVIPRSLPGRIVGSVWWFFALILVCSYTANLAAYLIVDRIPGRFSSFATIPGIPISLTETLHVVAENNIEINSKKAGDYEPTYSIDQSGYVKCNSFQNAYKLMHVDFAMALSKGSPLREPIDLIIVELRKNGVLSNLLKKWLLRSNSNDCSTKDEQNDGSEITLGQVAGVFYVLLGGLVLALAVALLEFCQHGRLQAARANVPLRAALRAKSRIPSREPRKHALQNNRTPSRDHERLGWNGSAFAGYFVGANQISQDDAVHASFTHV